MNSKVGFLLVVGLTCVWGHARMFEPPNRSSLWRFPEFEWANPEPNYVDDELWCENIKQYEVDTRCGICGDPLQKPVPRENERGGRYGRNIIARNYTAGQSIPIEVDLHAPHGGYLKIQLCSSESESENCFQDLRLSNGMHHWPMKLGDGAGIQSFNAELPGGVTCNLCTLRMHYRGAQHWGDCDNSLSCECDPTGTGGMGCSEQQTFRSCADITIR